MNCDSVQCTHSTEQLQLPNANQSLEQAQIQKDIVHQGSSTGGSGSDDIKVAMKIVLLVCSDCQRCDAAVNHRCSYSGWHPNSVKV